MWRLYTRQQWLKSPEPLPINNHIISQTTKIKDYELLFQKPLEEITVQEVQDKETSGVLSYIQGTIEYSQLDNYAQYYDQLRSVLTIDLAQSILGEDVTLNDIETNKTNLVKGLIEQGIITANS